ncbi:MAG: acyltransferase family protein [Candidatus Ventricola sp.]
MQKSMDNRRPGQTGSRLRWLDAVRGLAMLLVMIGHTVPGNETVIGALYTFHLPLFFVISGYASRPVRDARAFWRRHVRSFFQLIVPCAVVQMGLMVYLCLLEGNLSAGRLIGLEKRAILQLFWAGAQSVNGRPALGIPWFLFALFWGRLLFDVLRMAFKRLAVPACVLVSAAGLAIGTAAYLPQSLELAMVSVLFLCAGEQLRRLDGLNPRVRRGALLAAALVWALGLWQGVRIDMAIHRYGRYGLGIPVSLCASAVVCALMQRLDGCDALCAPLAFVGRISLPVFFVHHLDDYFMGWWARESWWLCWMNRIVVVVGIAALVHAAAQGIRAVWRCARGRRRISP